ncbi:hypothetical protein DCAR_0312833 [Daucus carota subsp. sativus]|uniref:Uncharacterized protein n=1 Tax=Daucus carota subsp. sativus TaxID=79200 RepID=A0A166BB15_DAUCS|nr:PREDICTED: uncharacterized protein LOC108213363 [Daucus carota subsp. sativus]WOG93547.1 hypothetical protein DCAR_0312833 [Daucus carota subsp. sativus]
MFRTAPQHRRGGAAATPDNRLAIVVRGSVTSLWSLLTKHAARTSRKFVSGNSSPRKLMSTISNKAINLRRKKRVSGEEEVDGGVWRRTILMGDKCQPLDFSGVIYYDNEGNRVSELPSRSPRASPLPSFAYKSESDDKGRLGW